VAATGRAKGDVSVRDATREEQAYVRRVAESRATIPDLWVADHVRSADAPSTAQLVRAFAAGLAAHPAANGAWRDGRLEQYSRINIGVVLPTERGLVTPTVADADQCSAKDIETQLAELGDAARAGTLAAPAQAGATATLWDLGISGVASGGAIVTPGQAVALSAGAVRDRAIALTLTFDHRVLDAWSAGALLARVRDELGG